VWKSVKERIEALRMSEAEKERLLDMYRFQLEEIENEKIKPGEDAQLDEQLPRLKNADKLRNFASLVRQELCFGDTSAQDRLGRAARNAKELAFLDASVADAVQLLENAAVSVDEASRRIESYAMSVDADPRALDALITRQDKLCRLKKKYGPELSDVIAHAAGLKIKISDLETTDERLEDLANEKKLLAKELACLCDKLHDKRKAAAGKLSRLIEKEITPLGFVHLRFEVSVQMEDGAFSPSGADTVEFLFTSNPDQPLKPLKAVASGGELSRLMLGLKTVLSDSDKVPVLVFDEVDAGIGGVVGRLVGEKLAAIAGGRQLLCITHLAQVAGFGQTHFCVSKTASGGKTAVSVQKLEGERRVQEIALMLGGRKKSSELGLKHARELIEECAA
jgi:DNA repair protein RecN (Recombination protein N)